MKKSLFAMTAMLSISAAFMSCSNKEVFDQEAAEQAKVLETEKQYKEAFVKHFGEVDPNQSWDFSQINNPSDELNVRTRANNNPTPVWTSPSVNIFEMLYDTFTFRMKYPHAVTDFEEVKQLVESQPVVD